MHYRIFLGSTLAASNESSSDNIINNYSWKEKFSFSESERKI